jgi:hypothetical protein
MNWKPFFAAAAAVTAVATVGLVVVTNGGDETTTNVTNGNNCAAEGASAKVECPWNQYFPDPAKENAQDVVDKAREFADVPPSGDGPWPFAVANSVIGLKVRSSNVVEGEQLGGIQELHVAWVVCKANSGFDPDPTTGVGSLWYKVKWDQHTLSTAFYESAPRRLLINRGL